jgi:hypothetical protein
LFRRFDAWVLLFEMPFQRFGAVENYDAAMTTDDGEWVERKGRARCAPQYVAVCRCLMIEQLM